MHRSRCIREHDQTGGKKLPPSGSSLRARCAFRLFFIIKSIWRSCRRACAMVLGNGVSSGNTFIRYFTSARLIKLSIRINILNASSSEPSRSGCAAFFKARSRSRSSKALQPSGLHSPRQKETKLRRRLHQQPLSRRQRRCRRARRWRQCCVTNRSRQAKRTCSALSAIGTIAEPLGLVKSAFSIGRSMAP